MNVRQALGRIRNRVAPAAPPKEEWFVDHYVEWRDRRVRAIEDHYGSGWFAGKRLLEVGAGFGDIGAHFARLGARVVCTDARRTHVREMQKRYGGLIEDTRLLDLDGEWTRGLGDFDLLLHLGVLYHLADPKLGVERALRAAPHVVLETEVSDSSDPSYVVVTEERGYDQAYNAVGCRPSPALIEHVFDGAGRPFEAVTDSRCNSGIHRYDWPIEETGRWEHGLRRFWFVAPGRD